MSGGPWEIRKGSYDGPLIGLGYRHPAGRELRLSGVIRVWDKPWRVIGWRRTERVLVVENV